MLIFFFFNDTATTEIYTLSLHDALPISRSSMPIGAPIHTRRCSGTTSSFTCSPSDRKSTRLNSSHVSISYAVFCLKKKKQLNGILSVNYQYFEHYYRLHAISL